MTDVHVQYIPLDSGAPVVLVEAHGRAYAAVDRNRRDIAEPQLQLMLTARYGPGGWNMKAAAAV